MKTLSLMTFATLALAACGDVDAHSSASGESAPSTESIYTVTSDSVAATVAVEGTVNARHRAEIATRMMARVTEVAVDLGSAVRTGQVLIRLGLEDVEPNRARAEAAVTAARAARDEAARHAARMDTLVTQDAVARVQRDQAHLGLAQADAQLAMAEAAMREVDAAAGYARIEAPFDGVVVARTVDPGDVASPGMPLLVIESAGPREAVLTVPPEVAETLRAGATMEISDRDGRTTVGTVRAIAGGADPMTRTVEVRVALPADWPTGVSVSALVPDGRRSVITIPVDAVVRRGQLTGVTVMQGATASLRWVRLGREVGDRIEVLSGLEVGERIAR